MRFPKAQEGVKLLFVAEIVALIIGFLSMCYLAGAALASPNSGFTAVNLSVLLLILLAGHLGVGYYILFFTGMRRAKQDEPRFKYAILCTILLIAAAFIGAFAIAFVTALSPDALRTRTLLTVLLAVAVSALSCGTMLCIASGVKNLAKQLDDGVMAAAATRFQIWIAALCASGIVLSVVKLFVRNGGAWITTIALVPSVITYILTLIFLDRARLMLAR